MNRSEQSERPALAVHSMERDRAGELGVFAARKLTCTTLGSGIISACSLTRIRNVRLASACRCAGSNGYNDCYTDHVLRIGITMRPLGGSRVCQIYSRLSSGDYLVEKPNGKQSITAEQISASGLAGGLSGN